MFRMTVVPGVACAVLWMAAVAAEPESSPAVAAREGNDFQQCIADLQRKARDRGRSERVITEVLAGLEFQPRVIELDQRQPEFTETFTNYLNNRVTATRIARGRELLAEHRELLQKLQRDYGVPPQYLVAFWGLETNYGSYLGRMPVLDSLATLACHPRRAEYFSAELLTALELLEREQLTASAMQGSWAGAMGHTQFMPSAYHRYAVDGDGDGKIDLWNSVPDALTSAANFLRSLGWQPDQRWGREVRLPDDFDYAAVDLDQRRPLRQWREMGLTSATGASLPALAMEALLVVPAGHTGPAFLVYDNFDVIMRWNRSRFYALAVGHLADRINGAGGLQRPPPADAPRLTRPEIEALQTQLNSLGFAAGKPDGVLGPATRKAVRDYQVSRGLVADGYPGVELFTALAHEPSPGLQPEDG